MRKFFPTLIAGTIFLGGCAAGMGGNPIGDILGSVLGGNTGAQGTSEFERAAVNACGQQASQYGRVSITRAEQNSQSTVRVDGRIEARDGRQGRFTCTFRSDGRIVDFRTA